MTQEDRQGELRERTEELLHGALKHVRAAALAASLVPLAAVALSPAVALGQASGGAPVALVDLTNNPDAFRAPVGIDCQGTSGKLVATVNASTGLPHNFDLIDPATGQITQFSSVSGAIGEIKVAAIHVSANQGAFAAGQVYAGNGVGGGILRISADGAVVTNPWVILPGEAGAIGGLFQDRYGVAGGDLVVATGNEQNGTAADFVGNVWRITASGGATLLRSLGKHLEGVTTVPNDTVKYGPLAGQILVGDEDRLMGPERDGPQCRIIAIDPITGVISATVSTDPSTPASGSTAANYHVAVALCPKDLDVIFPDAAFFGVDFSGNRILTAPASDFANFAGDLLVTKEFPTGDESIPAPGGVSSSGLNVLHWNDVAQEFSVMTLTTTQAVDRWEHVTFAGGAACGDPVVAEPAVSIVVFTNGADANDPRAAGVPNVAADNSVTWTYRVTNTGNTPVPRAEVAVADNTAGVTPAFTSAISGNGDTIFDPEEVWLYTATGVALDLTLAAPPGVHTVANSCKAGGTQPRRTAYTNVGTATIPGASASDPSSYCNPPPPGPPLALPCPAGSFTYSVDARGDLNIVYDQFPAPNDNSYGVNAVGWGTKGHEFKDLVGSDRAGFQLVDAHGVVKLDFRIDYITAKTGTPSGYASLGAAGGDGKVNLASDGKGATGITGDSSLARNLNTLGYFVGGTQVPATKTATNGTDLLVDSPKTVNRPDDYTLLTPNPWDNGWDFHDTYFVTISAARLASLGFDALTWKARPNGDQLHNSPAKACPVVGGGGSCNLSLSNQTTLGKELQIAIANSGSADSTLTAFSLQWPKTNGKLLQVKLGRDVVYDQPDLAPPTADVTTAQLVADRKKRTIGHRKSDVLHLVFQKNVNTNLTRYNGTLTFGNCVLTILP
jgi:hypothetical protein